MMDAPEWFLGMLIIGLGVVAGFLIKNWMKGWSDKLREHDERLGRHDVELATIKADMRHVRVTVDANQKGIQLLLMRGSDGREAKHDRPES